MSSQSNNKNFHQLTLGKLTSLMFLNHDATQLAFQIAKLYTSKKAKLIY